MNFEMDTQYRAYIFFFFSFFFMGKFSFIKHQSADYICLEHMHALSG